MSEGEKMDELDAVYKELGESEIIRRNQMAQVVALEHERDEWKDKFDSFTTRIEQLERISADKALRLIKDEISWSKKNKSDAASADFENGFIKGLEQAKFLINKIINQF